MLSPSVLCTPIIRRPCVVTATHNRLFTQPEISGFHPIQIPFLWKGPFHWDVWKPHCCPIVEPVNCLPTSWLPIPVAGFWLLCSMFECVCFRLFPQPTRCQIPFPWLHTFLVGVALSPRPIFEVHRWPAGWECHNRQTCSKSIAKFEYKFKFE